MHALILPGGQPAACVAVLLAPNYCSKMTCMLLSRYLIGMRRAVAVQNRNEGESLIACYVEGEKHSSLTTCTWSCTVRLYIIELIANDTTSLEQAHARLGTASNHSTDDILLRITRPSPTLNNQTSSSSWTSRLSKQWRHRFSLV